MYFVAAFFLFHMKFTKCPIFLAVDNFSYVTFSCFFCDTIFINDVSFSIETSLAQIIEYDRLPYA